MCEYTFSPQFRQSAGCTYLLRRCLSHDVAPSIAARPQLNTEELHIPNNSYFAHITHSVVHQ